MPALTGPPLLRPFHLADLGRFDPPLFNPLHIETLAFLSPPPGRAFTAEAAGRVLGCAGVICPPGSRVGRAWAILGSPLRARPMVLHRRVARRLPGIAHDLNLEAVQAAVRADYRAGRRWVAALGFTPRKPEAAAHLPLLPGHLLFERRFPAAVSFHTTRKERSECPKIRDQTGAS